MSLYQKYRPCTFQDLTGQKHVSQTLQNALKLDLLSHAYLFCGPRGTGKTTSARILSKAVNCLQFDAERLEPCNQCSACGSIDEGSVLDVIEIDAASNRGIDEIRLLKENVGFAPTQVKNKVYIIDEVHMLTNEAFNALLKTLEEPPSNVYFILATTEAHKIPETIVSRCQKFNFERLSIENLVGRLEYICKQEKIKYEAEGLEQIAAVSSGGMRDSISLLDQVQVLGEVNINTVREVLGKSDAHTVEKMRGLILELQIQQALDLLDEIYMSGSCLLEFSQDLILSIREQMYIDLDKNSDMAAKLSRIISLFYELKQKFHDSGLMRQTLEVFVIQTQSILSGQNIVANTKSSPNNSGGNIDTTQPKAPVPLAAPKVDTSRIDNDISQLKEQIRNLQTIVDSQKNLISNQSVQIKDMTSKIEAVAKSTPLDKMTPMLDSALKMLEKESQENEDAKPVRIYAEEFDLGELKQKFEASKKHIKSSSLKRALNQATLEMADAQTLALMFSSQFLIKTVDKLEFIDEIEQAIAKEYKLVKVKPMLSGASFERDHNSVSDTKKAGSSDPFALDPAEEALRQAAQEAPEAPEAPPIETDADLAEFFEGEVI